ncbi:MAG: M24 family metallopeptidase [Planctomycetaceae bacterium]
MPILLDRSEPFSSAEFATVDGDRVTEVARRHKQVIEFLEQEGYDALLLQNPANMSWLTAGGDFEYGGSTGSSAALFVTTEARVIVCNNIDTPQILDFQAPHLGFQLKERNWTEPRAVLLSDLCRGRKVASDVPFPSATDVGPRMLGMRLPLCPYDVQKLRTAGRLVAHAVEATLRALRAGRTESEIAGEISHRMIKHQVTPQRIQIFADGRALRYRHWKHSEATVRSFCSVSAVGRYQGLNVGAVRTACLETPSTELLAAFEKAAMVAATGLFFSQRDWELFEVWNRVKRIYEKTGVTDEWRIADQADVVEYEHGSISLMPSSEFRLSSGVPIFWHPLVGPVLSGDSVVVTGSGAEILTPATDWPTVPISVKGSSVPIPAILVIEPEKASSEGAKPSSNGR